MAEEVQNEVAQDATAAVAAAAAAAVPTDAARAEEAAKKKKKMLPMFQYLQWLTRVHFYLNLLLSEGAVLSRDVLTGAAGASGRAGVSCLAAAPSPDNK